MDVTNVQSNNNKKKKTNKITDMFTQAVGVKEETRVVCAARVRVQSKQN